MTKIRIAAPSVLAVDLELAKANLGIDGSDMDALVTTWIKGVVAALEHEIGQCLMEQTWRVVLDAFPCAGGEIALPHPVMAVSSLAYIDKAGVEQTLDGASYKLNRERYRSTLTPTAGTSWPATMVDRGVVTVELQCGYGNTPEDTPENCQLFILAKLVEQFDPATRLERDTVQSMFIDHLLDSCRSYA
jgi:uncharacterized phiE125 gp8 family phage protein